MAQVEGAGGSPTLSKPAATWLSLTTSTANQPRECSRCGGSFLVRGHGGLYCGVSYCSRECQQADRNERRAEKRGQERERQREPVECVRCGKGVPPERSTRRYCSDACRQAAYRERTR